VRRITVTVAVVLAAAGALLAAQAGQPAAPLAPDAPIGGGNTSGFLSECIPLADTPKARCYARGLLAAVEQAGDPARNLPEIDRKVHEAGGYLEAACHSLMHEVGRTWARRHDVTIENLYHFVPRSNDPGCSAGFGMGLAMFLGPALVAEPRSVLRTCSKLPTRFREYTCVHGAGHAFMRGFHSQLRDAVTACNELGVMRAPDCSQGAFHDYWISLGGADGTMRPTDADTSPESVCGGYTYKRPCWYRYFWEREADTRVYVAQDILGLCGDLEGLQRAGCVGGASLLVARERDPVDHARVCAEVEGTDTYNCLRGVNVPAVANRPFEQLRLIRTCGDLPTTTRYGCYAWLGRTLAVVTDGAFRVNGCPQLAEEHARISCAASGAHMGRPLRTFS
jgi:hypothetical protein